MEEKNKEIAVSNTDMQIEKRKKELLSIIGKNYNWISYVVLAFIIGLAVFIRTRPLRINSSTGHPYLWDITTNTWTLGPDLDPFLFLRWAQYIAEHGKLFVIDAMRYSPLGLETATEMKFHAYLIVWWHKIFSLFLGGTSVVHSAVTFPVIMFVFTIIAFFFLVRIIFYDLFSDKKIPNIIALISSVFLSVIPSLLPRTIAGIPEKESVAFLFMFLAFYFFLASWKSQSTKKQIIFAILAGCSTAAMALIWGGYVYVFMVIGFSVFVAFLLGQTNMKKVIIYAIWIISSFILMYPFSTRYQGLNLLLSINTIPALFVLVVMLVDYGIRKTVLKNYFESIKKFKMPLQIYSIIASAILASLIGIAISGFDFTFIYDKIDMLYHALIRPAKSRLIQTVAENRQPYFTEWGASFGPTISNLPVFFWMFFIGSIVLFVKAIKQIESKPKIAITIGYVIFLISMIFSRYSGSSILNGENFVSLFVYFAGALIFLGILGYYYFKLDKDGKSESLKHINFEVILLLSFFILGIISARGAVRVIMMLVPPTSAIVAYFVVDSAKAAVSKIKKRKPNESGGFEPIELVFIIIAGVILISAIFCGYSFYKESKAQAESFHPSGYNWQWQKAMAWVRENTPKDAVFGHWWDYGYWLQSIGERATVLDGGNAISYWNHLMGREVLTTTDDKNALEFLYTHNTTYYLIDSTDIGKYGAYSNIGSNVDYDRQSYIPTFFMDEQQTQETKNTTIYVYVGGIGLDEDIFYENNGTKYMFAKENSGIAGVLIEESAGGKLSQPMAVFVQKGVQANIPLRYIYYNGNLTDFNSGIESGVFIFETLEEGNGGLTKNDKGVMFYLSKRTVNSFLARKYLFGEEDNFKLVHKEYDYVTDSLKSQGFEVGDFSYFRGQFLGPIKIWKIEYPSDIKANPEYLSREYPEEIKNE
ncbi:MAG: STT3 domain-containing protein [Candidatus Pacearchaeota archaeon]